MIHYLGQTLAVFILKMCLNMEQPRRFRGSTDTSYTEGHVISLVSQPWVLVCLQGLEDLSPNVCRSQLSDGNFDIVDILMEACVPLGWTDKDEALLAATLGPIGESGMPSL